MRQLIITLSFIFPSIVIAQTVTVSPSILSCGQTTVTLDWGCDWGGEVTVFDFFFLQELT